MLPKKERFQQAVAFDILNWPFRSCGFSQIVGSSARLIVVIRTSCGLFRLRPLFLDKLLKPFQPRLGLLIVIALGDVDVEADA